MRNLSHRSNSVRSFKSDQNGTAILEFGLLLPFLVVFLAFIGEFSRAIYQFHVAEKGVKNAARYLARVPDITVCAAASFDTYKANAVRVAQKGSFDESAEFKLPNWQSTSDVTVSINCVANAIDPITEKRPFYGPDQIPVISVSTEFDFNDLGWLNIVKVLDSEHEDSSGVKITATHQEIYVGD